MNVGRGVWFVVAASLLSGCAGARQTQAFNRLQSQVSLLEERIGQLERSQFPLPPAEEALSDARPVGTTSATPAPSASKEPGAVGASAVSFKPTTRQIQQALKNAGFYQGTIDGKMGPMTREAIREFQRVHGLVDDSVVGKKTWAKLKAYEDLSAGGGDTLNAAEVLK